MIPGFAISIYMTFIESISLHTSSYLTVFQILFTNLTSVGVPDLAPAPFAFVHGSYFGEKHASRGCSSLFVLSASLVLSMGFRASPTLPVPDWDVFSVLIRCKSALFEGVGGLLGLLLGGPAKIC